MLKNLQFHLEFFFLFLFFKRRDNSIEKVHGYFLLFIINRAKQIAQNSRFGGHPHFLSLTNFACGVIVTSYKFLVDISVPEFLVFTQTLKRLSV